MPHPDKLTEDSVGDPPPRASARRKLLFAATLLVLVLLVIEGGAWIADGVWHYRIQLLLGLDSLEQTELPPPVVESLDWPGASLLIRDPVDGSPDPRQYRVAGRSIPGGQPTIARQSYLNPADIPADRKPVFILGGSAAFGFPYAYHQSLAGILDRKLAGQGFAIINAAEPSRKSNHLVAVARRIIEHFKPHALVIFCGNNEWQNWRLPDFSAIDDANVATYRALARSRAIAALLYLTSNRTVDDAPRESSPPAETDPRKAWQPHIQMSGIEYALLFPLDADQPFNGERYLANKARFLDTFEQNLSTIVASARASDVRVFLLTIPFNHKLSPAWNHQQPESFDLATRDEVRSAIRAAASLLLRGDHADALPLIDRALELDPHPPILSHMRGLCLEAMGRPDEAEDAYAQCRENMLGHLGTRLAVNQRIRKVAAQADADLIDVQDVFKQHELGRGKRYNQSLILDDCHPAPQGHALIAAALVRKLTSP